MATDWSRMAGYVQTQLDMNTLASKLATAGLNLEIRERCYASGNYYIRIFEGDDLTLDFVSPVGYRAEGLSSSVELMFAATCRVSAGLTEINIPHRFELYDRQFRVVHSVQHLWPSTGHAPPLALTPPTNRPEA